MNNLNLKNTSYDEILKEYKKTKEFNDSIFLDSSLLELIGGKGKSKLAKKMKKGSKKKRKKGKKGSKKGKKKRNNDSDSDDSDSDSDSDSDLNSDSDSDSDSDLDSDVDNNYKKNKKRFDFDTQINKYEKKIKKLTRTLFKIKANKNAYDAKNKASDTANTVLQQLTQSGGDSDENSKQQKPYLIPLPRIFPQSDITSSETVSYVLSGGSSTSSEYSSSEYSSSEYSSSETPSSSSSKTQGVIGDVVRGAGKLFKYLTISKN